LEEEEEEDSEVEKGRSFKKPYLWEPPNFSVSLNQDHKSSKGDLCRKKERSEKFQRRKKMTK
jgi:hypothetical protein